MTTSIAPFFEPGAPARAMRLLTSETEFLPARSTTILTQELPRAPTRPKVESSKGPRKLIPPRCLSAPLSEDDSCSSPSDSDNSDELSHSITSDSDSDDGLIPKPPGEAGRPKRGGYNLELELSWDPRRYRKLKVCSSPFFPLQFL